MNTQNSGRLLPYITGGLLAVLSEGLLGVTLGVPTVLNLAMAPSAYAQSADVKVQQDFAQLVRDVVPGIDVAQQVNRSSKGDRLIGAQSLSTFGVAPDLIFRGSLSDNRPAPERVAPATAKPVKDARDEKLPEGCNASISPLSDRVAAKRASNCVTALEVPWKVASISVE
jgi:hypothetical protein